MYSFITDFLGYMPGEKKGGAEGTRTTGIFPDDAGAPTPSSKQARQTAHARFLNVLEQLLCFPELLDHPVHILDLGA